MNPNAATAIIGLVFGVVFLAAALASTLSKVRLGVFNWWHLREVRHREHPRAFIALVLVYGALGLLGIVSGIAALFEGLRL